MSLLRVHVQDDATQAAALRVSEAQMRAALTEAGFAEASVSYAQGAGHLPEALNDAELLFTATKLDFSDWAARAPKLRVVQTISAGVEVFLKTLPAHIALCNASGVHAAKGSEFILAGVLMLNFGVPGFVDAKAERRWLPTFGGPLAGKRVILLGVGAIGGAAAERLRGFGLDIVAVSRGGAMVEGATRAIAIDALDSVLPDADFLVSTLPLTPQTKDLMSRERLERLKPGAGVVSVGRADVFDNEALLDLLNSGHIGGAVLDVFPVEPLPPDSPFWRAPRTIITPHCSLDDHAGYRDACLAIFVDNVRRFAAGEPLRNRVDPARGY